MNNEKTNREVHPNGGITIGGDYVRGDKVTVGRDLVRGDKTTIGNISITQTSGLSDVVAVLAEWQSQIEARIDAQPSISTDEKRDLKEQVGKIQTEAAKGEQADLSRLEKLINTLAIMAPDIFDVAITTLSNPLGGIGLVLKKIGDKAKLERSKQSTQVPLER